MWCFFHELQTRSLYTFVYQINFALERVQYSNPVKCKCFCFVSPVTFTDQNFLRIFLNTSIHSIWLTHYILHFMLLMSGAKHKLWRSLQESPLIFIFINVLCNNYRIQMPIVSPLDAWPITSTAHCSEINHNRWKHEEFDWPMYVSPSLSDESSPDAAICARDSLSSSSSLA